jgi:AbrB family looped-hinge helix DNA binding protein
VSRITSKYQLTIPKAVAQAAGLKPGDDVACEPAGTAIRVRPLNPAEESSRSTVDRLALFDQATERQRQRDRPVHGARESDRGWTRNELYER